jgi:Arc/MetJ-type ribon-helix-helix transcriptional regulator
MQVKLKPETQKFIDEQVTAGRFRTSDELLDEAVGLLMTEAEFELDEETVAAIKRADEQFARGEGIDFDTFAAEWRKKLSIR